MDNAKLTGYVLVSSNNKLLVHKKFWAGRDITKGWIWSDEEISRIIVESNSWITRPAFKQAAYLDREDGQTVIFGDKEILT